LVGCGVGLWAWGRAVASLCGSDVGNPGGRWACPDRRDGSESPRASARGNSCAPQRLPNARGMHRSAWRPVHNRGAHDSRSGSGGSHVASEEEPRRGRGSANRQPRRHPHAPQAPSWPSRRGSPPTCPRPTPSGYQADPQRVGAHVPRHVQPPWASPACGQRPSRHRGSPEKKAGLPLARCGFDRRGRQPALPRHRLRVSARPPARAGTATGRMACLAVHLGAGRIRTPSTRAHHPSPPRPAKPPPTGRKVKIWATLRPVGGGVGAGGPVGPRGLADRWVRVSWGPVGAGVGAGRRCIRRTGGRWGGGA
jgi:hypothetical protein